MSENRSVTYAIGGTLGGPGIGTIAGKAVESIDRNGLLQQAYGWAATDLDVPPERVSTVPLGSYIDRVLHYYRNDMPFDLLASHWMAESELFHGWNNMCLRSLRAAREAGSVTVVERASAHPVVQREIVETEFEKHGVDEQFIDDRTFRRAMAEIEEADAITVPSDFVYETFLDRGFSPEKLVKIPYGVDIDRFEPKIPSETSDLTAVFVGQVSIRKGVQYLLPAWRQADVEGTLKLAGDVRGVASDIVAPFRDVPDIEFLGFVDDVERVFREADVFVFPSIEDGFGLVILEAMATATPVITTSRVGASELVIDGESGFVVEPADVDSVADHLETLAADPERRRAMGELARETAETYTWTRYGDALAAAYRSLLSGDPAGERTAE